MNHPLSVDTRVCNYLRAFHIEMFEWNPLTGILKTDEDFSPFTLLEAEQELTSIVGKKVSIEPLSPEVRNHTKAVKTDSVAHPAHYNSGKIEVIEAIEDWKLDYPCGNAVKYIARAGRKDPTKEVEDLEKAVWYLKRKIENLKALKEGREPLRPNDMNPPKAVTSGFTSAIDASNSKIPDPQTDTATNAKPAYCRR